MPRAGCGHAPSAHLPARGRRRAARGAAAAGAHVLHTVAPGETLWSIAAQNNLTTRTSRSTTACPPDADVVLGHARSRSRRVAEGAAALAAAGAAPAPAAPAAARRAAAVAAPPAGAPPPLGAYVVRPGDTLSALAAQTGVPRRADGRR